MLGLFGEETSNLWMRHKSFFMSEGVAVFKVPMHSPPPSCFPVVTLGSRSCTIRPSRWTRSCGSCWRRSRRRGRSRRSQCRQRSGDSHAGECPAIAMCPNICSIPPQCAHIRHIHVVTPAFLSSVPCFLPHDHAVFVHRLGLRFTAGAPLPTCVASVGSPHRLGGQSDPHIAQITCHTCITQGAVSSQGIGQRVEFLA